MYPLDGHVLHICSTLLKRKPIDVFVVMSTTVCLIIFSRSDPLLANFVQWVPFLHLSWRKFFLSVCQVGRDVQGNALLSRELREVSSIGYPYNKERTATREDILLFCGAVIQSPMVRSIISSLLRSAPSELSDNGSNTERLGRVAKEFQIAKTQLYAGKINYQSLFDYRTNNGWTIYSPITPRWRKQAKDYMERLVSLLTRRTGVIYPQFQRRKNMSRESAMMLRDRGYHRSDRQWQEFGTVDLERHYMVSGEKIKGGCEMRLAWKYNELKPRAYYCIGGQDYWPARYVKQLAIDFMEANPITKVARRTDPTSIRNFLDPEDWIALWDLTSFTTSLVELREFLFYVCRYLESDLRCRDRPLALLDTREGVIHVPVWELLDDYNSSVNEYSEFSMLRLIDQELIDCDLAEHCQANSGMLGVPGNIGLSTALHGVHILPIVDKNKSVGVGDDEMTGIDEDPEESLYPHVGELGKLQLTKTGTIRPQWYGESHTEKFVKRGLTRTENDLYLDKLFDFPILAYGFGEVDKERTVRFTPEEGLEKILRQIGSLYWDIRSNGHHVDDEDIMLAMALFSKVYARHGIIRWRHGALPGVRLENGYRITACIPPIDEDFDPRYFDWSEVLWDRSPEMYYSITITGVPQQIPEFEEDLEFATTETRLTASLEALGVLKKIGVQTEWIRVDESNRRRFRESMRRQPGRSSIVSYKYTSFCPAWITTLNMSSLSTVPLPVGGLYTSQKGYYLENVINYI